MKLKYALALLFSLIFVACGESPITSMVEDADDVAYEADHLEANSRLSAERERDRYSSLRAMRSSSSSSDCYPSYYSSSSVRSSSSYSSSSSAYPYLLVPKVMTFTLTDYEQISAGWDGGSSKKDGDPRIKFKIFVLDSYQDTLKKFTSKTLLSKNDIGSWSGRVSEVFDIPAGSEDIWVCPVVEDSDLAFDDDYSSGYCFGRYDIGKLESREVVYQNDYASTKYDLYWEWYLY
ncbi:MAG: hypothetical protein HUK20_14075 [Fibrobacter sp.]|nr:hypothetical protein [Fibrobacter sp.]